MPLSFRATIWSLFVVGLTRKAAPTYREIGRLLWLVLDAGGFPDIGPDASIEAAQTRAPMARRSCGYFRARHCFTAKRQSWVLTEFGSTPMAAQPFCGRERTELDTGSWSVREDQLCRAWKKSGSQCSRRCQ